MPLFLRFPILLFFLVGPCDLRMRLSFPLLSSFPSQSRKSVPFFFGVREYLRPMLTLYPRVLLLRRQAFFFVLRRPFSRLRDSDLLPLLLLALFLGRSPLLFTTFYSIPLDCCAIALSRPLSRNSPPLLFLLRPTFILAPPQRVFLHALDNPHARPRSLFALGHSSFSLSLPGRNLFDRQAVPGVPFRYGEKTSKAYGFCNPFPAFRPFFAGFFLCHVRLSSAEGPSSSRCWSLLSSSCSLKFFSPHFPFFFPPLSPPLFSRGHGAPSRNRAPPFSAEQASLIPMLLYSLFRPGFFYQRLLPQREYRTPTHDDLSFCICTL